MWCSSRILALLTKRQAGRTWEISPAREAQRDPVFFGVGGERKGYHFDHSLFRYSDVCPSPSLFVIGEVERLRLLFSEISPSSVTLGEAHLISLPVKEHKSSELLQIEEFGGEC